MLQTQKPLSKTISTLLKKITTLSNEEIFNESDADNVPWLKHVFSLHEQLFGETCTGCASNIPGYINRIKNYNMSEQKTIPKYRLKPGTMILVPGTAKAYTEHNITDDIAKKLLKQNPNRKVLFIAIPEEEEKTPLDLLVDDHTKKELEAIAESLGIEPEGTKAVIAQAILDKKNNPDPPQEDQEDQEDQGDQGDQGDQEDQGEGSESNE